MTTDCAHDWRINPNVVLTTAPPQQQLVCADCGAKTSRVMGSWPAASFDPRNWPKA